MKVDDTDKNILFMLDTDARMSPDKIAKSLKMKRDTVAYRITRLERLGAIKGYYTLIDYSKIGYTLYRLYLKFQNSTPKLEREMAEYFIDLKSAFTVYHAEGDWDLAIGMLLKNPYEFNTILSDFKIKYKKYVGEVNISVFLEYIHYLRNYLVQENLYNHKYYSTGKTMKSDFDDVDIHILKFLSNDAKLPLLAISSKVNLTSMAVRYRIKKMEGQGIILGSRALIDHKLLGYDYYKVDLVIEDMSKLSQLRQFACQHPNIIYEDVTVGGSDFEFDVELRNYDEFFELIELLKEKFPGLIRSYRYYRSRKIFKYNYFPE